MIKCYNTFQIHFDQEREAVTLLLVSKKELSV